MISMSFIEAWKYISDEDEVGYTLGGMHGTDHFALFLHAFTRMQQPEVVLELGTGVGVTALMCAEALKLSSKGHLWTVDDGSAWREGTIRFRCQRALGYDDPAEPFARFVEKLMRIHDVSEYVTPVGMHMDKGKYFDPGQPIDILFADAGSSAPKACADLLRYYLPKMRSYSSLFIDRAATIHDAFMFLSHVVNEFERGHVPADLLLHTSPAESDKVRTLIANSNITMISLTETAAARKSNPMQNSTAWLKIEPRDYLHHNDVVNYW